MPHTEYWSVAMRRAVDSDVASGKKLASLGANQIYWRINPKSSPPTGADREYEIFRTGDTSRFRDSPDPHPEQSLLGAMFGCMHMDDSGTPNNTWLWRGVSKSTIPHLAQGEVDHVQDEFPKPDGLEVLTTTGPSCSRSPNPRTAAASTTSGSNGSGRSDRRRACRHCSRRRASRTEPPTRITRSPATACTPGAVVG
jgi:hypothetical protein